jgi:hypothetical protein
VRILAGVIGLTLIFVVLWEAFETIVLPRRVTRRFRTTRVFYRYTWLPWSKLIHRFAPGKELDTYLGFYGPLSLLLLLVMWAGGLVAGFALLHVAAGSAVFAPLGSVAFWSDLYLSGTTFFTLGLGDVAPVSPLAKTLVVIEAGMGFGFLAMVIGYLPLLNQAFSRRETNISMMDARAGSPPSAAEMLRRHARLYGIDELTQHLSVWERWSAELLESHLSYPVLAYFRSHHDNQSWLGALAAVLDACAFSMTNMEGACTNQARLTFAMARHAVADLAIVFKTPPVYREGDRLPQDEFERMCAMLRDEGLQLRQDANGYGSLAELRVLYEPYLQALGSYFCMSVPPWMPGWTRLDNWQTSAWERRYGIVREDLPEGYEDEHF